MKSHRWSFKFTNFCRASTSYLHRFSANFILKQNQQVSILTNLIFFFFLDDISLHSDQTTFLYHLSEIFFLPIYKYFVAFDFKKLHKFLCLSESKYFLPMEEPAFSYNQCLCILYLYIQASIIFLSWAFCTGRF